MAQLKIEYPPALDQQGYEVELGIWLDKITEYLRKYLSRAELSGNRRNQDYYPDASETDQGAATAAADRTLKDIIDSVGTSKKATIIFTHSGSGSTTTYTLTNSETVPSNINLEFENGAVIDGAGTLTIQGGLEVGDYQIFGSSITITFDSNCPVLSKISAHWFGADPDEADNDAELTAAAASIASGAAGLIHVRQPGSYNLDGNVTWSNGEAHWLFYPGATITGAGIIGDDSGSTAASHLLENPSNHATLFGKLFIRPDGSTTVPADDGTQLTILAMPQKNTNGVYIGNRDDNASDTTWVDRDGVTSANDFVQLQTHVRNSIEAPNVWGINPIAVKDKNSTDAGENTKVMGIEVSISNNTTECGASQTANSVEGIYISYIHNANEASAGLSIGGLTASATVGWKRGVWIDGVQTDGTAIEIRDDVSGNGGLSVGIDTVNTASFTISALRLGNAHRITAQNTSAADKTILILNASDQVVVGPTDLDLVLNPTSASSKYVDFANVTAATSATAGANGDVPSQVVGYIPVKVAGTVRKIPFYAT